MGKDSDIAVLQTEFKNLHDSQRAQMDILKEISTQTKLTNGRVNRTDERHTQEDKLEIPKRLVSLEKWKYGVMAVCTLVILGGYKWMTVTVEGIVREGLETHNQETEQKIEKEVAIAIEEALDGYEFNLTE